MTNIKLEWILEAFPKLEEDLAELENLGKKLSKESCSSFDNKTLFKKTESYMKTLADFFEKVGWKADYKFQINKQNVSADGDIKLHQRDNHQIDFHISYRQSYYISAIPELSVFYLQNNIISKNFNFKEYEDIIKYILVEAQKEITE